MGRVRFYKPKRPDLPNCYYYRWGDERYKPLDMTRLHWLSYNIHIFPSKAAKEKLQEIKTTHPHLFEEVLLNKSEDYLLKRLAIVCLLNLQGIIESGYQFQCYAVYSVFGVYSEVFGNGRKIKKAYEVIKPLVQVTQVKSQGYMEKLLSKGVTVNSLTGHKRAYDLLPEARDYLREVYRGAS